MHSYERARWYFVVAVIVIAPLALWGWHASLPGEPKTLASQPPVFRVEARGEADVELVREVHWRTGTRFQLLAVQPVGELHGFSHLSIYGTAAAENWACVPRYAARATWADGKASTAGLYLAGMKQTQEHWIHPDGSEQDGWTFRMDFEPGLLSPRTYELLVSGRPEPPTDLQVEGLVGVECKEVPPNTPTPTQDEIDSSLDRVFQRFRIDDPFPLIDRQVREILVPAVMVQAQGTTSSSVDVAIPPYWVHRDGDVDGLERSASGFRAPTEDTQIGHDQGWQLLVEDQRATEQIQTDRGTIQVLAGLWAGLLASAVLTIPLPTPKSAQASEPTSEQTRESAPKSTPERTRRSRRGKHVAR